MRNFLFPRALIFAFVIALSVTGVSCGALSSSASERVTATKLENGLSLFMTENHSVPLVYIEIAVRSGAVSQTKEDAGLFHLYEHMMFKGNALYPDAPSVQNAISEMGVASWNGTTSIDRVNYFFTIPSDRLEEGLAFWNAAIRTPLMKEDEFENEKRVVLAEIRGDASEPGTIASNHMRYTLFPDSPYKLDPAGSVPVVENATVSQLRDIQSRYYIPSNAALFVGGDIDTKQVEALVKKIYGSWSNNGNSVHENSSQATMTPFNKIQYRVIADENLSPDLAQVSVSFRGPDAEFAEKDTYTADMIISLADEAAGVFKQSVIQSPELGIPDPAYVDLSYSTSRRSGVFGLSAVIPNAGENLIERAELFRTEGLSSLEKLCADRNSFGKKKIAQVVRTLRDGETLSSQTASSLLSTVCFWWCCTEPEYYFNYHKNLLKVSQKDAADFFERYVGSAFPLVSVSVNPSLYEAYKNQFAQAGYVEMTEENSFWWKNEAFAPDASLVPTESDFSSEESIYSPEKKSFAENHSEKDLLSEKKLSNKIPVYFENMESSEVLSVFIGVKGGVLHLTQETSGLESSLFSVMGNTSENYDFDTRNAISYRTNASFSSSTWYSGSALTLNCVSDYADELLPVLTDGFLHPSYEKKFMDMLSLSNRQSVQGMQNNPSSILSYEAASELFKNHPYSSRVSVLPESIDSITEENMRSLHDTLMDSERIFVVVSGKFNEKKILSHLEKTLGTLGSREDLRSMREAEFSKAIPPVASAGEPVLLTHPAAGSGGFAGRYFAAPANESPDFIPAVIASDLYSELLFCVVREHYGACYTPSSGISGTHASLGVDYLYRLSNLENFVSYMKEAQSLMENGKLIESVAPDGEYIYTTVEKKLEGAKNAHITRTYGNSATSYGAASTLAYNVMQYDDPYFDRKQLLEVRSLTEERVLEVFRKYWCGQEGRWFAIVSPENEGRVRF